MKTTLQARFKELEKESIGAIITLSKAIGQTKCTKQDVLSTFKKFVPKEEYEKSERNDILADLYSKLNPLKIKAGRKV